MRGFKVQDVFSWRQATFIGGMHALAVLALFHISTLGLAMLLGLHFLTGCIGISVGYHRLISHRAFRSGNIMTGFMALCGALALQGGPVFTELIIGSLTEREILTPPREHFGGATSAGLFTKPRRK